jgi:hypothetical protein
MTTADNRETIIGIHSILIDRICTNSKQREVSALRDTIISCNIFVLMLLYTVSYNSDPLKSVYCSHKEVTNRLK